MRKVTSVVLAALTVTILSSLASAEDKKESSMDKGKMQAGMMEPGKTHDMEAMRKGRMTGMGPMMMSKSVVATSDGGVIVMIGNKLQKYDKDLVLQKEVELKIDMEGMKKMMMQTMEKCPMMSGNMPEEKEEPGEKIEPKEEQAESTK